jgi:hypothetical protein
MKALRLPACGDRSVRVLEQCHGYIDQISITSKTAFVIASVVTLNSSSTYRTRFITSTDTGGHSRSISAVWNLDQPVIPHHFQVRTATRTSQWYAGTSLLRRRLHRPRPRKDECGEHNDDGILHVHVQLTLRTQSTNLDALNYPLSQTDDDTQ